MKLTLAQIFEIAVANKASDIHLRSGQPPKFRVNGTPGEIDNVAGESVESFCATDMDALLEGYLSEDYGVIYKEKGQVDFATQTPYGRFRVNIFNEKNGKAAVFRALPSQMPTIEELMPSHLHKVVKQLASLRKGLVLVTGATGSGKSTTLAAMVNYINQNSRKHILTIEDPIEFVHEPIQSIISHREVGTNVPDFAAAIKGALREDPNVILMGEMRDLESTSNAITAAETGHLVLATLHSSTAASTIDRIIDQFPEGDKQAQIRSMLSNSIAGIISQQLIQRRDGTGRVGAYEVMLGTSNIRNLIRKGHTNQMDTYMVRSKGMIKMKESIDELVRLGIIDNPENEIDFDNIKTLDDGPQ